MRTHPAILEVHANGRLLSFGYWPVAADAVYDICDARGCRVRSGVVKDPVTEVDLTRVPGSAFVLLLLDGERSIVHPFRIQDHA